MSELLQKPNCWSILHLEQEAKKLTVLGNNILEEISKVKELYPDAEPRHIQGENVWISRLAHIDCNCIVLKAVAEYIKYPPQKPWVEDILYRVVDFGAFKTKIYSWQPVNITQALTDSEKSEGQLSLLDALKNSTTENLRNRI